MQAEIFKNLRTKPILKWAGGKQQLLSEILNRAPSNFNKFIEPFIGGGAVFFAIKSDKYVISDKNPELINLYKTLPGNVDDIIFNLKNFKNEEEFYYEVRAQDVKDLNNTKRAAKFIYLNRTCFK